MVACLFCDLALMDGTGTAYPKKAGIMIYANHDARHYYQNSKHVIV